MASFLVESFVPRGAVRGSAHDVDGLRHASHRPRLVGERVRHVRSSLVPGAETGFHVTAAPDAAPVVRIAGLACVDVERVVATIGIGPERVGQG